METESQLFWQKSIENWDVTTLAQKHGYCNAAASRYYYALRLAAQALFEFKGIDPPPEIWKGKRKEINTRREWPHPALRKHLKKEMGSVAGKCIYTAKTLRLRGDYETLPVRPEDLVDLRDEVEKVLENIRKVVVSD